MGNHKHNDDPAHLPSAADAHVGQLEGCPETCDPFVPGLDTQCTRDSINVLAQPARLDDPHKDTAGV